ncbi:MAG: hypothetical protein ACYDG5_04720 [Dehalococcoidales bacterium]
MQKQKLISFFVLLVIAFTFLGVNWSGRLDECQNWQAILGLFSGTMIGFLFYQITKTECWKKHSERILQITLRIWELLILAFTIFYMFPHIKENIFDHLTFFQPFTIFKKLAKDVTQYWHIYALFFFALIIWGLLLIIYEKRKKLTLDNKTKKLPIIESLFPFICLVFLFFLNFCPINAYSNSQEHTYIFFNLNTDISVPHTNPFLFYFLIGMFGAMFIITVCPWIKKIFFWIKTTKTHN